MVISHPYVKAEATEKMSNPRLSCPWHERPALGGTSKKVKGLSLQFSRQTNHHHHPHHIYRHLKLIVNDNEGSRIKPAKSLYKDLVPISQSPLFFVSPALFTLNLFNVVPTCYSPPHRNLSHHNRLFRRIRLFDCTRLY